MLVTRILSTLVLAPVALGAAWLGGWAFVALAALAAALLAWEWSRLALGGFGVRGLGLAAVGVSGAALGRVEPAAGLALVIAAALLARFLPAAGRNPWWLAGGVLYIALPALCLVWLREQGLETLLWLLFLVWATDIGAYAAGRTIGGPKLLPRVSPKKTWAGLAGGMVSAALVGAGMAWHLGQGVLGLALASAVLAVVAQAGDLAESWMKRYFGVKDSSNIIPGHGGVMDRLDGLLAAAPVVALICLLFGGGLAEWR